MNKNNKNPKVLFLIGPSGVGKSSVLIELNKRGVIELTPSWTTRSPRPEENQNTIEHEFVSDEEFLKLEKAGFFLEVLRLFNLPYRFGLPQIKQPSAGKVPALVLRTYLLPRMEKHYPGAITYALEDNFDRVNARLQKRIDEGEPLGSRLVEYENEIMLGRNLAKKSFKNNSTIKNLADSIQKEFSIDFN